MVFIMTAPLQILCQSQKVDTQVPDTTQTVETKVKGITCTTDLKMISDNVLKLEGVISCTPGKSGPTTTFSITFNPTVVQLVDINKAIESTGSCENPQERPYKVKKRKEES